MFKFCRIKFPILIIFFFFSSALYSNCRATVFHSSSFFGSIKINKINFLSDLTFIGIFKQIEFNSLIEVIILAVVLTILVLNILQKRKAVISLQNSENNFKEFAELLPQTIFECDLKGNFKFLNDHSFTMFGFNKEDFNQGLNVFQMISEESLDKAKHNFEEVLQGSRTRGLEYVAQKKNGTKFPIIIYSNPIAQGDKVVGIRGIVIDFSERKKIEEELLIAKERAEESDNLKSAFLSNISHEIRTPLNAIVGFSDILSQTEITEKQKNECIQYIHSGSNTLLRLINDIVSYSKLETDQIEVVKLDFEINNELEEIYKYFNDTKYKIDKGHISLKLTIQASDEEAIINTDPKWFIQIFNNLIDNALKYTEEGFIEFGYEIKNNNYEFFVKDTGIGISAENQDFIFNGFSKIEDKTKVYKGVGIGLAITKKIIRKLNGEIWVDSLVGRGSTFYFLINI